MTVKTGVLEMNGDGEDRARDLSCGAGVDSGQGHQKMSPGVFELPLSDGIVRLYANLFAYTRTFSPILKISFFSGVVVVRRGYTLGGVSARRRNGGFIPALPGKK